MNNNTIVVLLESKRSLEDRSWMCNNKGEACRLAQWLSENFIPAQSYTTEGWNLLHNQQDKD